MVLRVAASGGRVSRFRKTRLELAGEVRQRSRAHTPAPAADDAAGAAPGPPRRTPQAPATPAGDAHCKARTPPRRLILARVAGDTRPEQHARPLRQTPLRQEPTMTKPHRNARSGRHERCAPSLPTDAAQEGRIPDARPDNRPQKPTIATPRSPGIPPEHAPSHGPEAPSGKASGPHGPPDRPAAGPSCPSGSGFDAPPQASSTHRSMKGLPLLPLFRPGRRSHSPGRSATRATRSRSRAFSNSTRATFSSAVSITDPG